MAQAGRSPQVETIEDRFKRDLLDISEQATKLHYYPARFVQMIHELGAFPTAKALLIDADIQSGLVRLWELGRLDLSLEAQVLKPEYSSEFSDVERRSARERLEKLGWPPSYPD